MPAENFLIVQWQREIDSLKKHLDKYDEDPLEVVHKIRINIKKLRAYLKLYLLICKKHEERQLFSETDKLFSILGEHRNLELNKARAKEISCGNEDLCWSFLAWLIELQGRLNIQAVLESYDPSSLDLLTQVIKQNLGDMDNELLLKEISCINERYLKKVRKHMHHFRHNAHQIRKELKVIFYLSKISLPVHEVSKKELELLDETLNLLGNIQDDEVTIELVEKFQVYIVLKHDKKILESSVRSIEMRKHELLEKVHEKTEKFLEGAKERS